MCFLFVFSPLPLHTLNTLSHIKTYTIPFKNIHPFPFKNIHHPKKINPSYELYKIYKLIYAHNTHTGPLQRY